MSAAGDILRREQSRLRDSLRQTRESIKHAEHDLADMRGLDEKLVLRIQDCDRALAILGEPPGHEDDPHSNQWASV
jgi:hypothetical protein